MTTRSSRPISTLCLNPALDVTYHVPKLIPDEKSRSESARYDPGGNGINIGRAMTRLGVEAHTLCVIAGAVGQILKTLLDQQLNHIVYEEVEGQTRINTTIIETDTYMQYQVTGRGTDIPGDQLDRIASDFVRETGKGYGILTGSCQSNIPVSLYADLIKRINQQGGRAVVDCHGDMLAQAITAEPFLIKPNKHELETLLGKSFCSVESIAESAREIQRGGVNYVCVSLSHEGAILVGPNNSYYAEALDVPVNTTVGAGDSMVAGLVAGFSLYHDPEEALKLGIACGSGTVMHPGTELFKAGDIVNLKKRVKLKQLTI
ncbi:MAG: 1-phosphofructokinase [Methylophaga sp.]